MSFINECSTIIRFSNKYTCNIYNDSGIKFDYFDEYNNLISSNLLSNSSDFDFTKSYFNLGINDNIYGVYKDTSLNLVEVNNNCSEIIKKELLTFNHKKFDIIFPYIKIIDNDIHILYYVYNNNSSNTCALFHHFRHNKIWTENKIDFINHVVLNDFKVLWTNDTPIVFYFKLINGCEEVFSSRFNHSTLSWSTPIQLTNSGLNKLYLSVLKDNMNFYHLTFCEEINNGYSVKYINGYLNEYSLDVNISAYISDSCACMFPSLMKHNSMLYIMWIDNNRLYNCISNDTGKSWSEPNLDEFSLDYNFTRANFLSNCEDDHKYSSTNVFTILKNIELIGF